MSHANRVHAALAGFTSAHEAFMASLDRVSETQATLRPANGGWTPAQIAMHVALANERFASLLIGARDGALPMPPGFQEAADPFSALPPHINTSAALEPPETTRATAMARLAASSDRMSEAIMSLSPERAAGLCVRAPFGMLSLYQLAEFAALHVARHHGQLKRALKRD
jgi:hypothetical protein